MASKALVALAALAAPMAASAYDNTRNDNMVVYWGQNSYGAVNADDTANWQKDIGAYCDDDTIDVFPISFVTKFFGAGDLPEMNLASTCNAADNTTFSGSNLPDCSALASQITACQAKGKILTISFGGAGTSNTFTDEAQASSFADTIWNLFLGGTSDTRPFGDAVLDGIDLDIESGGAGNDNMVAFVKQLRTHYAADTSKSYYVTAAPQCVFPDANLGDVISGAEFDAIYVQFYNNQCGVNNYDIVSDWNFGLWDYWATNTSPNKNVKIYIGAPASSSAGGGYVAPDKLSTIATTTQSSFSSFGGVMLWDASQSVANNNFHATVKTALTANGGTSFTYPACDADAYSSGGQYTANAKVSYQNYIWEAKWWTQAEPTADANGDWVPVSACKASSKRWTLPSFAAWK